MIEVKKLTKRFEQFTALKEISCTIPKGCIYGMVGSNGAGKSTFLRLLTGIYKPDGGTVLVEGEPVFDNPAAKSRIAFVPDELYFLPSANMERMAKLYASIYPSFDYQRFEYLTKSFQLDGKRNISAFSKGMKRQAAIILALSSKPDYLFFDETFDGLDPVMRNLVKGLISQDLMERKSTAIITSHSLRELEDTCDQLALLHKGGLIFESDIQNLKTTLFKIQVGFTDEYDKTRFEGLDILHYVKHGSIANMIVRGDKLEVVKHVRAMQPVILDVLPLSLEDVFTYEMEALGYEFSAVLEGVNYEQKNL